MDDGQIYGHGEIGRNLPPKPPNWFERQVMKFFDFLRDRWFDLRNRGS